MPSIINSDNGTTSGSAGLKFTSADDGILEIQNSGNTAVTVASSGQTTFVNAVSQPGAFMFRNRLMNAQGLINQRSYVSGTSTSGANQYTLDRWRVVTSGQNLTFSTSENEVTFTAPAGGVEQVIEGLNLESGTYVLSWTGTATATVGGSSVANGGTVNITGGTDTTVRFSGGTFKNPQFERGNVPSSFERRPFSIEFDLCKRYYYKLSGGVGARFDTGHISNSTTAIIGFSSVQLRSNPTITQSGMSIVSNNVFTISAIIGVGTAINTNIYVPYVSFTISGATIGYAGQLRANATGAYLIFDSEF